MKYKNLTIIGTSHIARQSLEEVKNTIKQDKPDIIAVELDRQRYYGLLHQKEAKIRLYDITRVGFKGWLFGLIGAWAEKKLGQATGISPGSEMKTALLLAKENNIKVALIDQNIEITLKKLSKSISWKERWHFLADLFNAFVLRKKEVDFDLTKVPSSKIINMLLKKVKARYPNIYRILIDERNQIMANNLHNIMEENPEKKILAVLGAGHEEEILDILKKPRITYKVTLGS